MPTSIPRRPTATNTLHSAAQPLLRPHAPTPAPCQSPPPDDVYEEIPEKRSPAHSLPNSPTPDSPRAAPVSQRAARQQKVAARHDLRAVQTQEFEAIMRHHAQSYAGDDDDASDDDTAREELAKKLCAYVDAVHERGDKFLPKILNFTDYMGFLTEDAIAAVIARCPRIGRITLRCTATGLPKSYSGTFSDGWLVDGTLSLGDKTFEGKFDRGIPTGYIVETLHTRTPVPYVCQAMWKDGRVEFAEISWKQRFDPFPSDESAASACPFDAYEGPVVHQFDARRGPIAVGWGKAVLKTGETVKGMFVDNNFKPDQDDVSITYHAHERGWREFFGSIKGGTPHQGRMTFRDESVYDGAWAASEPHGEGDWDRKASSADAVTCYEGVFDAGNPAAGHATIRYANGSQFKGEVAAGQRDLRKGLTPGQRLQGEMTYASGDRYEGSWLGDKRSGQGEMTYASGDRYTGSWLDDKRSGQGEMTFKPIAPGGKTPRYRGTWLADQRSGHGTLEYRNGAIYTGAWLADQRSGQGTWTREGTTHAGHWQHDRYVPSTFGAVWNWFSGADTNTI